MAGFFPEETFFILSITDVWELDCKKWCGKIYYLSSLWTNCLFEILVELLPRLLPWCDCVLCYCFQECKKPEN